MTIPHDRKGGRRLLALAVMAAALTSPPCWADPLALLPVLDDAELAAARGGMMINGIPVNFAIVIRSTVDSARSQGLQTTLTVNDQGGLARADTVAFGAAGQSIDHGMAMALPGGTTIIHQVVHDQLQTLLANSADHRVLSQVTDINVDLPGFTNVTQTWQARAQAGALGRDAAMHALGR